MENKIKECGKYTIVESIETRLTKLCNIYNSYEYTKITEITFSELNEIKNEIDNILKNYPNLKPIELKKYHLK